MARPKTSIEPPETLTTAYAIVPLGGGWALRTYLVSDRTPYEDSAVDTFAAIAGQARREIAKVGK